MEETALPILELGTVLLATAAFGFVSRRIGLPAVVGHLVVGLVAFQLLPADVRSDGPRPRRFSASLSRMPEAKEAGT